MMPVVPRLSVAAAMLCVLAAWAIPALSADEVPPKAGKGYVVLGSTRFRHGDRVAAMSLSPDGSLVAAAGGLVPVSAWRADGTRLKSPPGEGLPKAVAALGGTNVVYALSRELICWDADRGRRVSSLRLGRDESPVMLVSSPDGKHVACVTEKGAVVVRASENLLSDVSVTAVCREGVAPAFMGMGERVAVFTDAAEVVVAKTKDGAAVKRWTVGDKDIEGGAFSADGEHFLVATKSSLRVYTTESGKRVASAADPDTDPLWVAAAALSVGAKLAATFDSRGQGTVWDLAKGQPLARLRTGTSTAVISVAFTRDGKWVYAAGAGGCVRCWEAATGKERFPDDGHRSAVTCLAVSADGATVISGGSDDSLRVWDGRKGVLRGTLTANAPEVVAVRLDEKTGVVTAASGFRTIYRWKTVSEAKAESFTPLGEEDAAAVFRHLAPAGKDAVAACSAFGAFALIDLTTRKIRARSPAPKEPDEVDLTPAFFAHGKDRLVRVRKDGHVAKIDTATGRVVSDTKIDVKPFIYAAVSPSGDEFVLTHIGGGLTVVDTATLKVRATVALRRFNPSALAVSPKGTYAAADTYDGYALIDTAVGKVVGTVRLHSGQLKALAFSADGEWLVAGSEDTTVSVCSVRELVKRGKVTKDAD